MAEKKAKKPRRKFRNQHVLLDGMLFPSRKEAKRWEELRDRAKVGTFIRNVRCQVKYDITINGMHVCTYIADFVYEKRVAGEGWVEIVEDVKGYRRSVGYAVYRLKAKLMKAVHGVTVSEA